MARLRTLTNFLLIVLLVVSAGGAVLAQESTPEPTPEVEPATATEATPYVGIYFDEITLRITHVVEGSPAEEAGLQMDDVITAIDGNAVDASEFVDAVLAYAPGESVTFTIERDGETLDVEVVLGVLPADDEMAVLMPQIQQQLREQLRQERQAFLGVQLVEDNGVVSVAGVISGGAAESAGLMEGDVITAVNGETIETAADLTAIVQSAAPGDSMTLSIERDGEPMEITAELDARTVVMEIPFVETVIDSGAIVYLPEADVWEVRDLAEDHPLAEAGLMEGDRIAGFDGDMVAPGELRNIMPNLRRTGTVTLTVERDNETLEVEVPAAAVMDFMIRMSRTLRDGDRRFFETMPRQGRRFEFAPPMRRDDGPRFGFNTPFSQSANRIRLGITFVTLDEQTANANDVDVMDGALLMDVDEGSPAADAGLLPGDVIVSVDGDMVDGKRTLDARLYPYVPGDTIVLGVLRDGETLQIEVTLGHPIQRLGIQPPAIEIAPAPDA